MPYVDNQGVRIHYEIQGQGPPVVLQHGFRDSIDGWDEWGYLDRLKNDYRLYLVDARGHGASDKPHDPESYEVSKLASDIVAVLDDAGLEHGNYWGYSMGGQIGFGLAQAVPQRLHSLIIGGMRPFNPGPVDPERQAQMQIARERQMEIYSQGMEAVLAQRQSSGRPLTEREKGVLMANDPMALAASVSARYGGGTGFSGLLPTMTMPCMIYGGEEDGMFFTGLEDWVHQIPNVTYFTLPGLDHGACFDRSDLIVPQVAEFLAKVN